MYKKVILFNLAMVCIAAALGWYLRGAVGTIGAGSGLTAGQNGEKPTIPGKVPARSAAVMNVQPGFPPPLTMPEQPGNGFEFTSDQTTIRPIGTPTEDAQSPMYDLPPNVSPEDIEISRESGTARILRVKPGSPHARAPGLILLPPNARPEDFEISPESGVARALRAAPEPEG